jgi:hypothetical protein
MPVTDVSAGADTFSDNLAAKPAPNTIDKSVGGGAPSVPEDGLGVPPSLPAFHREARRYRGLQGRVRVAMILLAAFASVNLTGFRTHDQSSTEEF